MKNKPVPNWVEITAVKKVDRLGPDRSIWKITFLDDTGRYYDSLFVIGTIYDDGFSKYLRRLTPFKISETVVDFTTA